MMPLRGDRLTLGRSTGAELSYPDDAGLSRQHLAFEREGSLWWIRDLGSKNGTLVNGARLSAPRRLEPGDRITAGHMTLEFCPPLAQEGTRIVHFVDPQESKPTGSTVLTTLETALGAARAGEKPDAATRQARALLRAGRELAGKQPLSELFTIVLNLAVEAVDAARGVLMTLEGERLEVRAAIGGDNFRISSAIRDRLLREKSSVLIRDALLDADLAARASIVAYDVRSVMAAPLQTNDRVIGIIYVDCPGLVREFTREDLNLLTVMANVAAIRIEHARLNEVEQAERLLARELEQAAEIQRRLLPAAPPAIDGFDLAAYHAPCWTVGGDYYDFLVHPDGHVTLLVADVAGKGMPAALLMSSLQARVQVVAEEGDEVGSMVKRLNRLICKHCPGNRFITLFACVLDPRTGEMTYCNAGHNPPLLARASGAVDKLEGGGMILGIFAGAVYEQRTITMQQGDALVLFSDGITEAPKGGEGGEEFDEARLAGLVAGRRQQPAATIVEEVLAALTDWSAGAPAADDITLVVARRL